jgi:hypothetical protein
MQRHCGRTKAAQRHWQQQRAGHQQQLLQGCRSGSGVDWVQVVGVMLGMWADRHACRQAGLPLAGASAVQYSIVVCMPEFAACSSVLGFMQPKDQVVWFNLFQQAAFVWFLRTPPAVVKFAFFLFVSSLD